eukprot:TRINITY_DN807_c2_g1_i1.p1 TRINITY_DN807_c2_g1~~TRINITY_DN807_c2_g1_i1.p1  ORF type:complete len:175 (+),score=70.56 TRINITY_DN807_c2_g1_i1:70-525(+)
MSSINGDVAHETTVTEVMQQRCCKHNTWDNVRVFKRKMTLRCRVCQEKWRLPVEMVWEQLRCSSFDAGSCKKGKKCKQLHIYLRKVPLEKRVKVHGSGVLEGVNQKELLDMFSTPEGSSCSETASTVDTPPTRHMYTNDPYSWDASCLILC